MQFLRISGQRVFQHPQAFTLTTAPLTLPHGARRDRSEAAFAGALEQGLRPAGWGAL